MKIIYSILFSLIVQVVIGQVAIGKETVDGSGILDFVENSNKGIILPWVSSPSAVTGSLIFDTSDKKVKIYDGTNWKDLSIKEGIVDTSEIDNLTEVGSGIIIGSDTSNKEGVLVLEGNNNALILPKSNSPWINIKNPEAGTLVYDPALKLMCVYNGLEWTFWGQ